MSPTAGCTVRIAPEHLFSAHESGPVDEFTVVTVNVQHAAPPRAGALAAWLSGPGGADVAVLTEVGHGSGRSALQSALAAHGYHTVSPPDCPDYSVVLAARGTEPQPVATTVEFLAHRAVAARLDFSGAAITVVIAPGAPKPSSSRTRATYPVTDILRQRKGYLQVSI